MSSAADRLLAAVTQKYLTSGDFNGLPLYDSQCVADTGEIRSLISAGLIDLVRGDFHPNPHIKALPAEDIPTQLAKIDQFGLEGCLYPARGHLKTVVRRSSYPGKPFAYAMAMGMAQLEFWAFDIRAMEWYRNDPRFNVDINDISFAITIKDEFAATMASDDRDNISIARAGFCYDPSGHRSLAVFARDLAQKPSHHQVQWQQFVLDGSFRLQEDFFVSSVLGDWPRGISVFDAFLEERKTVSAHLAKQGKGKIFRSEYGSDDRPDRFGFILRPTARELADFHQTLDKILSDDIAPQFFEGLVETHEVVTTSDGKTKKLRHGTIKMLGEWLRQEYGDDPRARSFFKMIKEARERRQRPAHIIAPDNFDHVYVTQQREIMREAYGSMRGFRDLVQLASGGPLVEQSNWLEEAIIRFE